MRILKFNDSIVDIDDLTAIGIDYQCYDFKEPAKRKINISNTFTIPKTVNNLAILGNFNNVQIIDFPIAPAVAEDTIYTAITCDYWVNNVQFIKGQKVRIEEVSDRISCFIFQKNDIWDLIKLVKWADFESDFVTFLGTLGYTIISTPVLSFSFFMDVHFFIRNDALVLPFYYTNFYNYDPAGGTAYIEDSINIYLAYEDPIASDLIIGPHFCTYVKAIFRYLEWKYSVNFLTDPSYSIVNGNIWNDPYIVNVYTPLKFINVSEDFYYPGQYFFQYWGFGSDSDTFKRFNPLTERPLNDKTLWDFVNSFFQHFHIIADEYYEGTEKVIRLSKFDDLDNPSITPFIFQDWTGNLVWKDRQTPYKRYKPKIEGFEIQNTIKFKSVAIGTSPLYNAKIMTSLNKNLDATADILEIDAHIPSFLPITGGVIPDLSTAEANKTFCFFIDGDETDDDININLSSWGHFSTYARKLHKPLLISLATEYILLDKIQQYPKWFEVEKWLTANDVYNLQFFRLYYFKELNGSFFLNKIVGFNPDKALQPTTLELIKISNRSPYIDPIPPEPGDNDWYVDSSNNPYTDNSDSYYN
jgi:hypothetical protein